MENNTGETGLLYKAVIFDMDGTLIDSIQADFLAWQKLFADYKKTLSFENYIPLLGIKSAEVAQEFLCINNEDELRMALANKLLYFKEVISEKGIFPVPYANIFLKQVRQLKNIKIALATSSRKAKMEMVMKEVGLLDYFDVIVTAEDVTKGKPAPDIFIRTAEKLSVSPADCIVFEDAINGVKAAKNACMKCVALASPQSAGLLSEADYIIYTFKDLNFSELCHQLKNDID